MKYPVIFCFLLSFSGFSKQIRVVTNSGRAVDVFVNDLFVSGGDSPKVVVLDVKAFDCAPCRTMEINITSHVKDHFKGDDRVFFASKFGRLGTKGAGALRSFYCAAKAGGDTDVLKRALFKNNSLGVAEISGMSMIDPSAVNECMESYEVRDFETKEIADIKRMGVPYFPSVYIEGRHTKITSASQLINIIKSKL